MNTIASSRQLRLAASAVLTAFVLLGVTSAHAEFVHLTADIELTSWTSYDDPPQYVTVTSKVECIVGTNTWWLKSSAVEGANETWWYTGSNLVWQVEKPDSEMSARTFHFNGSLDSGPNGPYLGAQQRAAWLAFCSGAFLNRPSREVPQLTVMWKETWLFEDHAKAPAGFADKTVRFEDELGLPISLDVFAGQGQPLMQYRVQHGHGPSPEITNVLGWQFPRQFQVNQYMPLGRSRENWQLYLSAKGTLTSACAGAAPPR
jgi:hypothetical protein